jgi:hypothetical protein
VKISGLTDFAKRPAGEGARALKASLSEGSRGYGFLRGKYQQLWPS